jgi:hypothetical protein
LARSNPPGTALEFLEVVGLGDNKPYDVKVAVFSGGICVHGVALL